MNKFETVNEYISTFPDEVKVVLEKVRKIIRKEAPEAEEAISYQIPTFKQNGKYLIYFAGWKNHISLYPIPNAVGGFKKKITPYIAGKGTLRFPLDKPIPYELIKEIVEFKIKEIFGK